MKAGVCSVSFRKNGICEIIEETKKAGLKYIEWGADVHIHAGKVRLARKVKKIMNGNGIKCESYGSYYGIVYHKGEHKPCPFKYVLKTAQALGAKTIRIWGGFPGCVLPNEVEYIKTVLHTREICAEAKKYGMTLSLECHFGTMTDDYEKAIKFIQQVGCDNLKIYFQPNPDKSDEYNLQACRQLLPYTTNVHVFKWNVREKRPLAEAKEEWKNYISVLKDSERLFLLEFMPDEKIESLKTEAYTLKSLLEE